jgi:hypothetical protein
MEVSMKYVILAFLAFLLIWDIFWFKKSDDKFCKVGYLLAIGLTIASLWMWAFRV